MCGRTASQSRRPVRTLLLVLPVLLLSGCALQPRLPPAAITPAQLLDGRPLTAGQEPPPLPAVDILGVDDAMRRFVAGQRASGGSARWRLRELLRVLLHQEGFVIEYQERTYTAAEAFRLKQANCLAFTNLFVALAREVGLTVHYQEVDVPPDWSRSGDSLVQNRHINTVVDIGRRQEQMVDFNMDDFRASYDRRAISDDRARAHYYSNIGVERMVADEPLPALLNFRKAIAADASFVPAWINLGSLYQHAGAQEWAEAAWQHALRLAPREFVALSNLEQLYRASGRVALADGIRGQLVRHRQQNPYYRYQQAEAALAAGNYPAAISHLRFAIARKPNEDRFYALLGLAFLRQGDVTSAQRWLARAAEVAGDDELRNAYHGKLELLRRQQLNLPPRGS
ncbi:MAG: tetratricopeptide repeat protein [Gammaproteobacteria bacterium]